MKTADQPSQTPLSYARTQLKFGMKEWKELTEQDQEDLRRWAVQEMKEQGIEVRP